MMENLYITKINYADLMLIAELKENYSKRLSKFINENYEYSDFHITRNEFNIDILLINETNNISIRIDFVLSDYMRISINGDILFTSKNYKEFLYGLSENSIRKK